MVTADVLGEMQVVAHTLRFCKVCEHETAHELCVGKTGLVRVCVPCRVRRLDYELDRD